MQLSAHCCATVCCTIFCCQCMLCNWCQHDAIGWELLAQQPRMWVAATCWMQSLACQMLLVIFTCWHMLGYTVPCTHAGKLHCCWQSNPSIHPSKVDEAICYIGSSCQAYTYTTVQTPCSTSKDVHSTQQPRLRTQLSVQQLCRSHTQLASTLTSHAAENWNTPHVWGVRQNFTATV